MKTLQVLSLDLLALNDLFLWELKQAHIQMVAVALDQVSPFAERLLLFEDILGRECYDSRHSWHWSILVNYQVIPDEECQGIVRRNVSRVEVSIEVADNKLNLIKLNQSLLQEHVELLSK